MKRSDVGLLLFFGLVLLLSIGFVMATTDPAVDPANDPAFGEPLDPALQYEPAPSDGGGIDLNAEGLFGLSWLMIGIIAGGIVLFFIILIIVIVAFSGKKDKKKKGPSATPVVSSVPSVPGPSSGSVAPAAKPVPTTQAPVPQPTQVPAAQPAPTAQVAVPTATPPTQQTVQQAVQSVARNEAVVQAAPVQQVASQPVASMAFQQTAPANVVPQQQVTVESTSNVQYVKYYAQNLSHDPRIRIRYLLSAGNKLASSGDINGAKQVYAYIFEDYHHLTYHDDNLYNEIVNFRQKLS